MTLLQPHGPIAHQTSLSMGFPGNNTGVGCHCLLQRTFPIQGLNPHLLCVLNWLVGSLPLAQQGQGIAKVSYGQEFNMKYQGSVPTLPSTSWISLGHCSQLGLILPRSFVFVFLRLGCFCWHLQSRAQGCCSASLNAHDSPRLQRLFQPSMSGAVSWRKTGLGWGPGIGMFRKLFRWF